MRDSGNPAARAAAQRGLEFLAREAVAWQGSHNCYGCHVQGVTVDALATGIHNQYDVPKKALHTLVEGMLKKTGGARTANGFSYEGNSLYAPAKAFGGAAFAAYDQWVASDVRDDLFKVARELKSYQRADGSIESNYSNLPVADGDIHATFYATRTWRQVYSRSADDQWLAPLNKAEGFLRHTAAGWDSVRPDSLQDANYLLMGLMASGTTTTEEIVPRLTHMIQRLQNEDGSWGFQTGTPSAFATGQTLYALRQSGMNDGDPAIHKGMSWLIEHQQPGGGWSTAGYGKAEAMWAIQGLVSLDVLSVAVSGLTDGEHIADQQKLAVDARDNTGSAVRQISVTVDDLPLTSACGSQLSYGWDTRKLAPGKHLVDVVAVNDQGQTSRRRLEVYSGATWLTDIGTATTPEGSTVLSLRNLAGSDTQNKVEVTILPESGPQEPVYHSVQGGNQGAMSIAWDGKKTDGQQAAAGRYKARLSFRDALGKVVQTEEVPIVNASAKEQEEKYSRVQGALALPKGVSAANTKVELMDNDGKVVQQTVTTDDGVYRFKNVDPGKYKVHIAKDGFGAADQPVAAAPAATAAMGAMQLEAK